jgi:hypothetical protein
MEFCRGRTGSVYGILDEPSSEGDRRRRAPQYKGARRTEGQSLGRPPREHHLPWDKNSLSCRLPPRLAPSGFSRGLVTGRAVVAFFRHARGTNATARIGTVCGCSVVGNPPNASGGSGAKRRSGSNTPRPNVSVVVAAGVNRWRRWV